MVITIQDREKRRHKRRIGASLLWSLIILFALLIGTPAFTPNPYVLEEEVFVLVEIPDAIELPPPVDERPNPMPKTDFIIDPNADPNETIDDNRIDEFSMELPYIIDRAAKGPERFVAYETAPRAVFKVKAKYPRLAREAEMSGWVELVVDIDARGKVIAARISRSTAPGILEQAALAAARQWRFKPALQRGRPVPASIKLEFNFRLH